MSLAEDRCMHLIALGPEVLLVYALVCSRAFVLFSVCISLHRKSLGTNALEQTNTYILKILALQTNAYTLKTLVVQSNAYT